jgi:mycothiol synthase
MTVELRPPTPEDAIAIAEALNEFNRPVGFDLDSPDEVAVWLDFPSLDLERDVRVALVEGEIVGYSEAVDPTGEGRFVFADVRAGPQHLDASAALLEFVEERARELASPGGRIKIWTAEGAEAWRAFLEARGYGLHRFSLRMVADLDDEPPEPSWPDGIAVRTRAGDEDDRPVYELEVETFADQGDDVAPEPFQDWRHWVKREPFDPELWFLASDGDQLAGISLCRGEWAGDNELGWVSVLGVRKPWRRKGLGSALLLHSFRELRARGKKRAGLGVRADNATGAVRLYERVGMRVASRHLWYEKAAA